MQTPLRTHMPTAIHGFFQPVRFAMVVSYPRLGLLMRRPRSRRRLRCPAANADLGVRENRQRRCRREEEQVSR
jgi:hypothetical protein